MTAHLRYLRYVLLHKLYVAVALLAIGPAPRVCRDRWYAIAWAGATAWAALLWRALVHDLSKFRPSEWRCYVAYFYGPDRERRIQRWERRLVDTTPTNEAERLILRREAERRAEAEVRQVAERFDHAWLLHQHRNPHHWQHWLLREDSGQMKVLRMPVAVVDEMLADWLGAGMKILRWPTLAECVAETLVWYKANRDRLLVRAEVRARIEVQLHRLATHYGVVALAHEQLQMREAAASIVVPGR